MAGKPESVLKVVATGFPSTGPVWSSPAGVAWGQPCEGGRIMAPEDVPILIPPEPLNKRPDLEKGTLLMLRWETVVGYWGMHHPVPRIPLRGR